MVLQRGPVAAGDVGTGDGVAQVFFNIGLVIAADKAGALGHITGQIDGKLQAFNGIGEACQQRQLQLQPFHGCFLRAGFQGLNRSMDGIADGKGKIAGHTAHNTGKIYQTGLPVLFCQNRFAVEGHIGSHSRHRISQLLLGIIHMDGNGGRYFAAAV